MTGMQEATQHYLPHILEGRGQELLDLFAGEPSVDDPRAGRVTGSDAFLRFAGEAQAWLTQRQAQLEQLCLTHTGPRTVAEWIVHLRIDEQPVPLPVAVVGEHPDGFRLEQVRVYHSMWPLLGRHQVRRAILPPDETLALTDVVARYQGALASGDIDGIVGTFEPDGYFREPAGGEYVYRGTERLRAIMTLLLKAGGILLEHCTVTDDGIACAIEFNAVQFGAQRLVPQAGVAVYERGASGHLRAARVYDDVNVEALAGAGSA